jgi:hypothetical protein|tara:strand:- start:3147 stop:4454 length:1308 start_codon:yes stop_codon:yes gene_type:complete
MCDVRKTDPTTSSVNQPKYPKLGATESGVNRSDEAALGKKRQNVAASSDVGHENKAKRAKQRRRERYADQRTAAAIYRSMVPAGSKAAGRGVTLCGWTQIANDRVRLVRSESEHPRAFYRGLQVCGLRWVCPCCTIRKSEESRADLNAALSVARQRNIIPVMLTLTARHTKEMSLRGFWSMLSSAEKAMKRTRRWKSLNARLVGGFAKAVEITHSNRNGWHPHFHLVMMTDADNETQAIDLVEQLRVEWLHQLDRVGLDGTSKAAKDRSFDVRGAQDAGDYITKWGAAEEMTLASSKVGKAKGRTPWELLRYARTGSTELDRMQAGARWWEFVQVMKGVHQLRQSAKFRLLVAAYEPQENEPEEPEESTVFLFDDPEWTFGKYKRLAMKEAAEDCTIEDAYSAVLKVLLSGKTDRDLLDPDDYDPGDLLEDIDPD